MGAEKINKGKEMINEDVTELLQHKVLKLQIANEAKYWNYEHIAVVMGKTEASVKRRVLSAPGFPMPIHKEQSDGTRSAALYVAEEVRAWIESDRSTRLSA